MKKIVMTAVSAMMVLGLNQPVNAKHWIRKTTIPKNLPKNGEFVTAIGDSVMQGAQSGIHKVYPKMVIDTQISRQVTQATKFLKQLRGRHALGHYVVIALGTNGPFTKAQISHIQHFLGNREIYWVAPYNKGMAYTRNNTRLLVSISKSNKHFHVIRWDQYIVKHKNYLWGDHCHVRPQYGDKYAHLFDPYLKYVGRTIHVRSYFDAATPKKFAQKFYLKKSKKKGFDYYYANDTAAIGRKKGQKKITDFINYDNWTFAIGSVKIGDSSRQAEKNLKKTGWKKDGKRYVKKDQSLRVLFKKGKVSYYHWRRNTVKD